MQVASVVMNKPLRIVSEKNSLRIERAAECVECTTCVDGNNATIEHLDGPCYVHVGSKRH